MGMEVISMTNQNSKSGTNSMAVPEAKSAMNRFKEEVASELGVNLKDGYNGDLTSREANGIAVPMPRLVVTFPSWATWSNITCAPVRRSSNPG